MKKIDLALAVILLLLTLLCVGFNINVSGASNPEIYNIGLEEVVVVWDSPSWLINYDLTGTLYVGVLEENVFMPSYDLYYWGRIDQKYFWRGNWDMITGQSGYSFFAAIPVLTQADGSGGGSIYTNSAELWVKTLWLPFLTNQY